VARAKAILSGLERDELSRGGRPTLSGAPSDPQSSQLGLFAAPPETPAGELGRSVTPLDNATHERDDEITRRLRQLEVDDTTPRQALELLAELKRLADRD
jgi:hypothetical protein